MPTMLTAPQPSYLSVHILHCPPPSNPNRGEDGFPKTMPYGNSQRYLLSSQSQKRAARIWYSENNGFDRRDLAVRSRQHHLQVAQGVITRMDVPADQAELMARLLLDVLNTGPEKLFEGLDKENSKNLLFLSNHEIATIIDVAIAHRALLEDLAERAIEYLGLDEAARKKYKRLPSKKELRAVSTEMVQRISAAPLGDVALFGRMMASKTELSVDGSVQVAYGMSVNAAPKTAYQEKGRWSSGHGHTDFFTAVDDLDAHGAGHTGHRILASPCYYRFASVALHELEALVGDKPLAEAMATAFIRGFAMNLPTGYQSATAHQVPPSLVLLRRQSQAPLSFAPAFESPIEQSGGIVELAGRKLLDYEEFIANAFGYNADLQKRTVTGIPAIVGEGVALDEAIAEALSA